MSVLARDFVELTYITVLDSVEKEDVVPLIHLAIAVEKLVPMRPLVWNKRGHQESVFDAVFLLAAVQKLLISLQYIVRIERLKILDLFRNLGVNIKFEALLIDNFGQHASVTHCLREKELLTR